MKILYSLFLSILFLTAYGQQANFEDQVTMLTDTQKDSVRKEINKAIELSDLYISTHYKNENNIEIVYLIALLDSQFNLALTKIDESKFKSISQNNKFILNLYGKVIGSLPTEAEVDQHAGELKRNNYDDFVNNEVVISLWSEFATKYPMPYNAIESMGKYYNASPLLQMKGLIAFKNLSINQNDSAVLNRLAYFKTKVAENLFVSEKEVHEKDNWALRIVSMAAYMYVTEEQSLPVLDWTKELKGYLINGNGAMAGDDFSDPDSYTNIYGLWALLELRKRIDH